MQKQKGFTLIEILVVIIVLLITLTGGVVVWKKRVSPTPTPTLLPTPTIPSTSTNGTSPLPTGPTIQPWKPSYGGECPPGTLDNNPNIQRLYEQTNLPSCGSLENLDYTKQDKVNQIAVCLKNALSSCKEVKAYVYIQGYEGYVEYLLTTKDCKLTTKRWGITTPYCGIFETTCSYLSQNFPSEVCP